MQCDEWVWGAEVKVCSSSSSRDESSRGSDLCRGNSELKVTLRGSLCVRHVGWSSFHVLQCPLRWACAEWQHEPAAAPPQPQSPGRGCCTKLQFADRHWVWSWVSLCTVRPTFAPLPLYWGIHGVNLTLHHVKLTLWRWRPLILQIYKTQRVCSSWNILHSCFLN